MNRMTTGPGNDQAREALSTTPLAARRSRVPAIALTLILLAFVLRFALSAITLGTNDWWMWNVFGHMILEHGLIDMYVAARILNHPPVACLWAELAAAINNATGFYFPSVFRLPVILSDAGSAFLLYKIVKEKTGYS